MDRQAFLSKIDMALKSPRTNSFRRPFLKSIRNLIVNRGTMSEAQARCAALFIHEALTDLEAANDNAAAALSAAGDQAA
jgi:hypothetical protein